MALDLLFPPRCAGCGRLGTLWCQACQAGVEPIHSPVCPLCGHPYAGAGLCPECRLRPSHLDAIAATAVFGGPLRQAIHRFKYGDGHALAPILGARLVETWRQRGLTADRVIPVPLHAQRLAERGYNQSALLARVLAAGVGAPLDETLLVRRRATEQQALLNAVQRRKNVYEAFVCQGSAAGLRIVLVDDVCTTGSTLEASAAALRAAGAASVSALTLARARWVEGKA
jgi:ComF family protein